jgi:membrane AbrB-like protein
MMGPMICVSAIALGGGRVSMPRLLVNPLVPILGLWLGSGVTPELVGQMLHWYPSLLGLFGWLMVTGALGFVYYRRVVGLDATTAFFGAMPGGLTDMTLIGASLGGDGRLIPLIHSVRMVLTIIIVPVSFRLSMHLPPTSAMQQVGLFDIAPRDVLILALCAVAGVVIAKRLRLPAPYMLGAMALSALVHVTGITASRPPSLLVSAAQVLVGAHVGARFAGVSVAYVGGFARQAATATMIILASSLVFATAVNALSGDSFPALVLAYSPGGLPEMSLVAIALGIDPTFVALHHLIRVISVVSFAPIVFRYTAQPGDKPDD